MQDAVAAGYTGLDPLNPCDDLPRLETKKDNEVAAASSGACTLIKCNLVSLIEHRYVDRVMTESGCDGSGLDYGIARRLNTAFAQRRATRTPQQVARAHGQVTQWVSFMVAVVFFKNATTDSERTDVGLLKSSLSPSPLRQTRLLFGLYPFGVVIQHET